MSEFITIIGSLTIINNFIVEFIKKEVYSRQTTLVAFITGQVITWIAYYFNAFNYEYLSIVILGLIVGLSSCVGYDKVKEIIEKAKLD